MKKAAFLISCTECTTNGTNISLFQGTFAETNVFTMEKKITDLTVSIGIFHGKVLGVKVKPQIFKEHQRAFVSVANRQWPFMNWREANPIVAVLTGPVKTKATRSSVKMEP